MHTTPGTEPARRRARRCFAVPERSRTRADTVRLWSACILSLSALLSVGAAGAQNIAPAGTAYRWAHGLTPGADGRSETEPTSVRVAAPLLNDGDDTVDVDLSGGQPEPIDNYEAAGVMWRDRLRTIDRVEIVHGSWNSSGDGAFCAGLTLQFSNSFSGDWRDSGWTLEPAYQYDSSQTAGVTYTFRGPPSEVRAARITGQLHCTHNSSYWTNIREVRAFEAGRLSLWNDSAVPTVVDAPDTGGVELGLRFRSVQPGWIKGVRFYKAAANTGVHVGNLWSNDGALLARANFVDETTSGWQRVAFATPVRIAADTTYVVSYYAPGGHYSADLDYFAAADYANGPLRALRDGSDGGNGNYRYGAQSAFPDATWRSANYWVDVEFAPLDGDTTAPSVPTGLRAIVGDATTVSLNWDASSDDTSAVRYRVYVDSNPVALGEVEVPAFVHDSAQPQTNYSYRVSAVDAAGNESARSPAIVVTTPPLGSARSCPPFPAFPNAACTGVPAGQTLTTINGNLSSTRDGQIINAMLITGDLVIRHNNVTVSNSRIKGFVDNRNVRNLVLRDVDVGPDACPAVNNGGRRLITGDNGYTLIRAHLHHNGDDMLITGGGEPVVIQDSLIHNTCFYPDDHLDAVQFYSPGQVGHVSILHSNIDARPVNASGYGNAAVFWADRPGAGSTLTIRESRLAGGGYTLAPYDSGLGSGVVIEVSDTRFVRNSQWGSACYVGNNSPANHSPTIAYNGSEGLKWLRNAWDDGTPLPSCQ
ncbi:DUF4082 domain-containing protein [Lysobacter capsici]|uniref:DUF4082 domain-containing protein n=1 Tax=Lysobacter capsici TaxID=435897 RepID=UPI00069AC947|nr:DUF4082 domain-containing protein [Lysobacter capsici]